MARRVSWYNYHICTYTHTHTRTSRTVTLWSTTAAWQKKIIVPTWHHLRATLTDYTSKSSPVSCKFQAGTYTSPHLTSLHHHQPYSLYKYWVESLTIKNSKVIRENVMGVLNTVLWINYRRIICEFIEFLANLQSPQECWWCCCCCLKKKFFFKFQYWSKFIVLESNRLTAVIRNKFFFLFFFIFY